MGHDDDGERGAAPGVRAWAEVAVSQADVLLRGGGEGLHQTAKQLTTIEGLLPEDDPLRAAVVPRLGLLLVLRDGEGDREAALPRLRWTHQHRSNGDPLAVRARLALLRHLAPSPDSVTEPLRESALFGADAAPLAEALGRHREEIGAILDRLDAAPLEPVLRTRLGFFRRLIAQADAGRPDAAPADLVGAAPGGVPPAFRTLLGMLGGAAGAGEEELARQGATGPERLRALLAGLDRLLATLPHTAPDRSELAKLRSYLRLLLSTLDPTAPAWDEADAADAEPVTGDSPGPSWPGRAEQERALAAAGDSLCALREGDPALLERAAAAMLEAVEALPEDSREGQLARTQLAGVLGQARRLSGSLQDSDASAALTRATRAVLDRDRRGPLPDASPLNVQLAVDAAFLELDLASREDDPAVAPRLIGELGRLHEALPPEDPTRSAVGLALGLAHRQHALRAEGGERAQRLGRARAFLRAGAHATGGPFAHLPVLRRAVVLAQVSELEPDQEAADEAIAALRTALEGPGLVHGQEAVLRFLLGQTLLRAALLGNDAEALDASVAELERADRLAATGSGALRRSDALAELSSTLLARHHIGAHLGADPERVRADLTAALAKGHAALVESAEDVLLQLGAEHGLLVARAGAAHGRRLAHEAAHAGRAAEAVAALELGRSMVLRAAAASRTVPGLLEDAGQPELAAEWRAQVPTDLLRPGAAEAFLARSARRDGPPVPSALRRRALAALRASNGRAPARTPGVPELAAGLAATGVDALAYLLPAAGENGNGYAVLLRPTGEAPTVLRLPGLTLADPTLSAYLDAAAHRSREPEDANGEARWRSSLDALCDWAGPVVMDPLLRAVPGRADGADPRIVLVPCGPLGVVAWHAARVRGGEANGGGRERRYACERAVISYAASGAELLRAAGRRRQPAVAGGQVLVSDPELTLLWAEFEAEALRAAFYPGASRYGEFPSDADTPPDAAGTPDDLLAVLPGTEAGTDAGRDGGPGPGPAVVHLACHATAGPLPTRSALRLADGRALTVARLLEDADAPGAAGPLVVLSACETDLSTRDHDEALTLATALVARGAVDVVGSRWAVNDGASAVLMTAFHHFLADRGLAPADALRAAQRWMLRPEDRVPLPLTDAIRHEAGRPDLPDVHLWAAFTHQGNPAPGGGGSTLR
ncbi:CHAT domain-containing protein [Streptomyces sp. 3MP-14]|uniref:CHAT domain-containing protein n=1 Tax=Streptomyces mimosae TaxID=2586635 RepID=A0A5N6ABU1_9ACTN|nr:MULTISPECIES: CHAT domain-containing protein [Streptomyces]KAB8165715.1 CHAT domain-containing protein [Streptomyces mimosae]KAB8176104.1 CHAT domain-containing protein [Streptomyces sp. 3MP-14]